MSSFLESLEKQFEHVLPFLPGTGDPLLRKMRKEALADALRLQFPSRKHPLWKYSKFDNLTSASIKLQQRKMKLSGVSLEKINTSIFPEGPTFIFINGFFMANLSTKISSLPFYMKHFKKLSQTKDPLFEELLSKSAESNDFFIKLNAAFVNDGAVLIIPEGYQSERPILIHHYLIDRGNHHYWVSPQIHIFLEKNVKIKIIEKTTCVASNATYINTQTYLKLAANSQCDYFRHDQGNECSHIFSHLSALQKESSQLNIHACTQNGLYHRMEIRTLLDGENTCYKLHGLLLADAHSHHDWVTTLQHAKAYGKSEQSVRSLIADGGRASYLGNIAVNPYSIKTLASMQNFHLILGKNGRADSSPQLEILCDDLKCNHHSSTEQLDEKLLFYITSRGIERKKAYEILLYAYIEHFLGTLTDLEIKEMAKSLITPSLQHFQEETTP